MDDYFSGFLDDIAAQDYIDFGGDFTGNNYDYLNGFEGSEWGNDPNSSPFNGMVNDGNGNWYNDPSGIVNQPDFESGNLNWLQQLTSGGLNSTLGQLGSAALIGTNLYQDYQTNELSQDAIRQQALTAAAQMKTGDANIYRNFTNDAAKLNLQDSDRYRDYTKDAANIGLADANLYSELTGKAGEQTTSSRDNAILEQYFRNTQPRNQLIQDAILGKEGVDLSGVQAFMNSSAPSTSSFLEGMQGYEGKFDQYADDIINKRDSSGLGGYANDLINMRDQEMGGFDNYSSDLINMRNQEQMYNSLKPQGALSQLGVLDSAVQPGTSISGNDSVDWLSTIPADADPAQVAAYKQFLGVA